ncbi:hypothetical protein LIER_02693 [Lithospermum erythrorhizon]|uniref:Uncharacterized protein n=1 Tax=Lithospermum erythrorhizon TaxID=34254 RepID=A0AAV3NSZ8_LITER
MLEELLKAKLIELPEPKSLEEANRSIEPDYCKYHRVLGLSIEKCFIFKEKVMDLARQGAILLEEEKVSTNHETLTILKKVEVKEPEDFWKSKLEPGMKWGDYPTDSKNEDVESFHMYIEAKDTPEAETTSEAPQTSQGIPQSFTDTFTDENILEEDGDHNCPLYISGYLCDVKMNKMLVDGGSAVNILPLHTLKLLGISTEDLVNEQWAKRNVVPSTLHQCIKYCKDDMEGTIKADENPFTTEEAHFADAKFYQRNMTDGLQPTERPEAPKEAQPSHHDREGEVIEALKKLTLPLTQAEKVVSTTLKGFVTLVQEPKIEHGTINPKAYDLLVKVGYDPTKDAAMSRPTPEVKAHGLNETQEKPQRKGYSIQSSMAGLVSTSKPPLRVLIKRMVSQPPKATTTEVLPERQKPYQ